MKIDLSFLFDVTVPAAATPVSAPETALATEVAPDALMDIEIVVTPAVTMAQLKHDEGSAQALGEKLAALGKAANNGCSAEQSAAETAALLAAIGTDTGTDLNDFSDLDAAFSAFEGTENSETDIIEVSAEDNEGWIDIDLPAPAPAAQPRRQSRRPAKTQVLVDIPWS